MPPLISQVDVMNGVARLSGKRQIPGGNNADWVSYCQYALDYAWRYYKWTWSLKVAALAPTGTPAVTYMPADFDLDGYREFVGASELPLQQYARLTTSTGRVALQYDATAGRYAVLGADTGTVIYQTAPPTLGDKATVPFPSAMTIAIGAMIYARQGENPTRADVKQDWELFHQELDRHVGRGYRNMPKARAETRYSQSGVNVGDS